MTTKAPSVKQPKQRRRAEHEDLLTVDDVCKQLGITEHTFYGYRKRYRTFRTVKVAGLTYMRRETLAKFLAELEQLQA